MISFFNPPAPSITRSFPLILSMTESLKPISLSFLAVVLVAALLIPFSSCMRLSSSTAILRPSFTERASTIIWNFFTGAFGALGLSGSLYSGAFTGTGLLSSSLNPDIFAAAGAFSLSAGFAGWAAGASGCLSGFLSAP